jgi:predicted phage terminase large subunit-like protein
MGIRTRRTSHAGNRRPGPEATPPPDAPPELRAGLEALRHSLGSGSALALRFLFAHWCRLPFSRLHIESLARYDALADGPTWPERKGRRLVLVAPRGHAKSAIHSTLLPVLDLCFRRERFIVLLSATLAQACARLQAIRHELRANRLLAALFPHAADLTEDNVRAIVAGGIRIAAFGAGCEIRGLGHGTARPTKIVLDDVEDSERVMSARCRDDLLAWYREVIEPLGDSATHVEIVGTMLHRESLLATLARSPHFEVRTYRAVEQWSSAGELWRQWTTIATNPDDPLRIDHARAFFAHHTAPMLAGTRVLWPEKESYADLMEQLVAMGRTAFFKEKQNEPPAGEGSIFAPELWRRFVLRSDGRLDEGAMPAAHGCAAPHGSAGEAPEPAAPLTVRDLAIVGFLDPSLGKGDWAAIATVGRAPTGVLYVLDLWLGRCAPTAQVERACALHRRWGYRLFGYEAVGFQSMLGDAFAACRSQWDAGGLGVRFDVRPVHSSKPKAERIGTLEPLIAGGWLRFAEGLPEELFAEARAFPTGRHDDALDALAGAVALARTLQNSSSVKSVALRAARAPRR